MKAVNSGTDLSMIESHPDLYPSLYAFIFETTDLKSFANNYMQLRNGSAPDRTLLPPTGLRWIDIFNPILNPMFPINFLNLNIFGQQFNIFKNWFKMKIMLNE